MQLEWQTVAALAVVAITFTIFLVRITRPTSKRDCGHGCGCSKTPDPKDPLSPKDHSGHSH